jgi:SAM-dependent methyltransferase
MGQDCEKFLPMCLESVKDADAIVYCDGGSTDSTLINLGVSLADNKEMLKADNPYIFQKGKFIGHEYLVNIIFNKYNQDDKGMNGKQRNFYLNYLKQNYPNDWALVLDADEVVEDLSKIKEFIQEAQPGLYHPKMRHFIGDLSNEDATSPEHNALCRLFKISEAGQYAEVEHPVLQPNKEKQTAIYRGTTIWHLGYVNGIFDVKKKYHNHLLKSNMHSPEYLYKWNMMHILGMYPTKPVNPTEIPRIILDNFGIEKDIFYFQNRGLNTNNFNMVRDWMIYYAPTSVLDIGCGYGNYGYVFKNFYGVKYKGIELSKFAVDVNPYNLDLQQGDAKIFKPVYTYDLILVLDLLEHLKESELDMALNNLKQAGNDFIFSIPFLGDPNLNADPTHQIKQSKEWWINKLSNYFTIRTAPETWNFANQILIGKRK